MGPRRCFGLLLVLGFTFATVPALSPEPDDLGIWDVPVHPQNFLLPLCTNYDLYIRDEKIDCYAAQLVPKSALWELDDNMVIDHEVRKRAADDQLEGSGSLPEPQPVADPAEDKAQNEGTEGNAAAEEPCDDEENAAEPQLANEEQHPESEVDAGGPPVDEKKGEHPVDEVAVDGAAESPVAPDGAGNVRGEDEIQAPDAREQSPEAGAVSEPKEDGLKEDQPQESDPAAEPKIDIEAEEAVGAKDGDEVSEGVEDSKEDTEAKSPAVATSDDQVSEDVKEPVVDETAQVDNQDVPRAETDKPVEEKPTKETPLSPFAVASLDTSNKEEGASDKELPPLEHETPKSETTLPPPVNTPETTTAATEKESESLDNKQSGSAVLDKEPQVVNPSSVEGRDTEKHLSALSASSSNNNEPNAGESAKNVSNQGKDATILVVLFVVVLVIGAAAFTHHFIKKRKQKTEEVKTLRNGDVEAAKPPGDVEKGVEMKPLLNRNDKPVIVKEFSDTKKAVEA